MKRNTFFSGKQYYFFVLFIDLPSDFCSKQMSYESFYEKYNKAILYKNDGMC